MGADFDVDGPFMRAVTQRWDPWEWTEVPASLLVAGVLIATTVRRGTWRGYDDMPELFKPADVVLLLHPGAMYEISREPSFMGKPGQWWNPFADPLFGIEIRVKTWLPDNGWRIVARADHRSTPIYEGALTGE